MAVQRAFVEHDAEEAAEGFASASRLRALAQPEEIAAYVPEEAAQLYRAELEAGHTPDPQRLDAAVLGVLRRQQREEFSRLPDLSEGIENRFWNAMRSGSSMEEILTLAKTKRYPHARLRRMMMHAFLGVTQEMAEELPAYLRVLGANERAGRSSRSWRGQPVCRFPHRWQSWNAPAPQRQNRPGWRRFPPTFIRGFCGVRAPARRITLHRRSGMHEMFHFTSQKSVI